MSNLYLGLDVGRTIRGAVIDETGAILAQRRVVSEVGQAQAFIDQLTNFIRELRDLAADPARVVAVGIGWPGLINRSSNKLEVMPNMVDLANVDLYELLSETTGLPIVFDNDANAGLYGEWRCGAAQGFNDVFYVTIGTGIGAGLIIDGRPLRGSRGYAGELGHTTMEMNGVECGCGNVGCLEALASGPNIVRRVRELLFSDPSFSVSQLANEMEGTLTFQRIVDAAIREDKLARLVLQETGAYLGVAIAGVVNLLNVELVVIGGSAMTAGEWLLSPTRLEIQRRAMAPSFSCCRIEAAKLGKDGGIIGAAMLARDTFSRSSP